MDSRNRLVNNKHSHSLENKLQERVQSFGGKLLTAGYNEVPEIMKDTSSLNWKPQDNQNNIQPELSYSVHSQFVRNNFVPKGQNLDSEIVENLRPESMSEFEARQKRVPCPGGWVIENDMQHLIQEAGPSYGKEKDECKTFFGGSIREFPASEEFGSMSFKHSCGDFANFNERSSEMNLSGKSSHECWHTERLLGTKAAGVINFQGMLVDRGMKQNVSILSTGTNAFNSGVNKSRLGNKSVFISGPGFSGTPREEENNYKHRYGALDLNFNINSHTNTREMKTENAIQVGSAVLTDGANNKKAGYGNYDSGSQVYADKGLSSDTRFGADVPLSGMDFSGTSIKDILHHGNKHVEDVETSGYEPLWGTSVTGCSFDRSKAAPGLGASVTGSCFDWSGPAPGMGASVTGTSFDRSGPAFGMGASETGSSFDRSGPAPGMGASVTGSSFDRLGPAPGMDASVTETSFDRSGPAPEMGAVITGSSFGRSGPSPGMGASVIGSSFGRSGPASSMGASVTGTSFDGSKPRLRMSNASGPRTRMGAAMGPAPGMAAVRCAYGMSAVRPASKMSAPVPRMGVSAPGPKMDASAQRPRIDALPPGPRMGASVAGTRFNMSEPASRISSGMNASESWPEMDVLAPGPGVGAPSHRMGASGHGHRVDSLGSETRMSASASGFGVGVSTPAPGIDESGPAPRVGTLKSGPGMGASESVMGAIASGPRMGGAGPGMGGTGPVSWFGGAGPMTGISGEGPMSGMDVARSGKGSTGPVAAIGIGSAGPGIRSTGLVPGMGGAGPGMVSTGPVSRMGVAGSVFGMGGTRPVSGMGGVWPGSEMSGTRSGINVSLSQTGHGLGLTGHEIGKGVADNSTTGSVKYDRWTEASSHSNIPACSTVMRSEARVPESCKEEQCSEEMDSWDTRKREDSKWVLSWLAKRAVSSHQQSSETEPAHKLKIHECNFMVAEVMVFLKKLWTLEKHLEDIIEVVDDSVWEAKWVEIIEIKDKIQGTLNKLSNKELLEDVKGRLSKRKRKRERQYRRQKQIKREKEAAFQKREQLHCQIDSWREEKHRLNVKARREKEMQLEADSILSEVHRKEADVRKMIKLITALRKLRQVRKDTALKRGCHITNENYEHFMNVTDSLQELLEQQLTGYEAEEQALKVMIDFEEKADENLLKNRQQKVFDEVCREWKEALFGKEPNLDDPVLPYFQFCTTGDRDLESLIQIRYKWDKFLVSKGTLMATSIPPNWVLPVEPSSKIWEHCLKEKK